VWQEAAAKWRDRFHASKGIKLVNALEPKDRTTGAGRPAPSMPLFDLHSYLVRQRDWSTRTFGPGGRLLGIAEHVGKELAEVASACTPQAALEEWSDIAILALDGAWRAGFTPHQVCEQLRRKQETNFRRQWPPAGPQDRANEHMRSAHLTPTSEPVPEGSGLCPSCNKNPASVAHSCPFQSDVYDNDDPRYCTCCPECEHECVM
jgi:hypothetical protein